MTAGALTGVGIGPGDPELITVKAIRLLEGADAVFVPVAADGRPGYAEQVVAAHLDASRLRRLTFALGDDAAERDRSWDAAGETVAEVVRAGGHAAFATIGDPNLYSTFTYLAETVSRLAPGAAIATVPGITAMQDLAARSGAVLAEGAQRVALLPFTAGQERLASALADFDTVVAYKGGRHLPRVRRIIDESGRLAQAVFGSRLGLDGEQVGGLGEVAASPAPYLSTVIVTRPRGARGAAL